MSRRKHRAYNWAHSSNESWHWIRYYILKRNVNGTVVLLIINISYLVDLNKNIVKKLWTCIKSKRQDNVGGIGPLDFQGETHTGSSIKANIFADYFSSVFTNEDISYIPSMEGDPLPCIDAIQVYSEGVVDLLSNINSSKSDDPDNLPARLLKRSALRLLLPLL